MKRKITPADDNLLLAGVGKKRITEIAKRLGRSVNATLQHAHNLGISPREEARKSAGMSIDDVAAAMGVGRDAVEQWVEIGWLEASHGHGVTQTYLSFSVNQLSTAITTRLALLPYLRPDRDWKSTVDAARAELEQVYISRSDIKRLLMITDGGMARWKKDKAFPDLVIRSGKAPGYYLRSNVRAWLNKYPQHREGKWQEI